MKTSHCHRRWLPFWENYKKASLSSIMWSLVLADGSSLSFNNGLPGQCPESWQFDNIPVFLVKLHKGFGHQCLWALTVAEYRPVHRWEKGNLTPRLFPSNKEVHQCSGKTLLSALTKECRVHTCINAANKGVDANALLLDIDSCRAQCTLVRLSAPIYCIDHTWSIHWPYIHTSTGNITSNYSAAIQQ